RKGKEKEASESSAAPMSPKKSSDANAGRPADSTASTAMNKSTTLGSFYHLPPYLKLYDVLKATHANYKLLKTLFGTNLASQCESVLSGPSRSQGKALRLGSSSLRPGLYHYCFMAPYTHFTQALADASLRNMVQAEQEQDASGKCHPSQRRQGGEFGTTLPEIPVDFLQEKDVFREFLYRINTLGWSSRTQFEETWATLLGVLVTQPITMDQEEETQQEEDLERTQLSVLAVQAISSLVLSAMALPAAGNPAREIQALVSKRDNVHTHHPYHAWDPVPSLSAASAGPRNTETRRKHRAGVDIHSCSQFLLELYSQWLIPVSPGNRRTPTILISEVVRSLLAVSDLFTERNQFDMMFSTLMELQKLHPPEDEILNQYLVPAISVLASGSEVRGQGGSGCVAEAVTAGHVGFSSGKEKASPAGRPPHADPQAPDSESVIVAMERVSVLFDRIRKGLPSEARVVSRILPQFLDDFFPPQDVMNKVIGEFLSNQQPYPQFMATVVYKVFQTLHATGQSSMVRDWVLLSLSNFTQRTPVAMAMWSLSCFFVSASTSQWISALLPHVVSRVGLGEAVDVGLFCLVAMDFYRHQIDEELDRRAFQSVFETVGAPGSPYLRLLGCLQSIHRDTSL
ncbi:unnamed protein product, partial [Menidia menidia]